MKLPILYKKTSTGAIQFWEIVVENIGFPGHNYPTIGLITTTYGQLGTDSPQNTQEKITQGKNGGKKNETTPLQQAEKEAKSRWEKQKKKGYVESIDGAQSDETDGLIEGGIVPMLAQAFSKHGHKIKYPCYVQPKLDGIRCIAIVKGGECTLWSRTRKPIRSMPHIVQELEAAFEHQEVILDGELYNHEFKNNFEHIVSEVRQEEPGKHYMDVEYHVYDMVSGQSFKDRTHILEDVFELNDLMTVRLVETEYVASEDQVMRFFDKYRQDGYEGAMLRNADSRYVSKRSYDLQKVKEFDDAEFDIIGIDEGRGKLAGHVGAFVCKTQDGKTFLAKMSGDTGKLADYFRDHSLWSGKRLTVKYQGLTGKEGVPRFPVGIAIRDYE